MRGIAHPQCLGLGVWFAAVILLSSSPAGAAKDVKLKKGARGAICITCHDAFQDVLRMRFIHTPLAKGECSGCHNPHTSNYGMLLAAEGEEMCYQCHEKMVPDGAKSVHKVVVEGRCAACHDPHAADNKMNLLKGGNELCFECHGDMQRKVAADKFEHDPVTSDCLECHNPHAAVDNDRLLKKKEPRLCLDCHEADGRSFRQLHGNYPVETGRCSACHDPHGSNTAAILFDNVHEPVGDGKCGECHEAAGGRKPFAVKRAGLALCEGCHYETVVDALNRKRVHWPLVDAKGCVNCHAPHGSAQSALLSGPMLAVCGSCHADTIARQKRSQTEHPPVAEGRCGECHLPHSSDDVFLMKTPSPDEVCAACHEWQTHSTHPIGENVVDPRNNNLTLQCASCHRTHGTEHKHFLYFDTTNEMCVECHSDLRR